MKKSKDNCSESIDLLRGRFKNRGIAEKVKLDAETATGDESTRQGQPPHKSNKYKTGVHDGVPVTTSDDFARYYKDLRSPQTPDASQRDEAEYEDERNAKKGVRLQSKKEMRLAIRRLIGEKIREIGLFPLRPLKLIEATNKGFDEDKPEDRGYAKAQKLPRGVLPVVLLLALSLLLIVSSSVMVSRSESDVSALESKLEELRELEAKLEVDLEVKNNMVDIKEIAEGEYGMVSAEYVASRYVYIEREDKIELGGDEPRVQSAFITLLEALGLKED